MKNFKLILKSLFSNPACVEGGRHRKWYFAVPIFILSMFIAIIPIFVQRYTTEGDSLVRSYTYGLEVATQRFVEDINEKDYDIFIKEGDSEKRLEADTSKWNEMAQNNEKGSLVNGKYYSGWGKDQSGNYCWYHKNVSDIVDLNVYILTPEQYNAEYVGTINYVETKDAEGNVKRVKRGGSYIIFSEKEVLLYIQNVGKSNSDVGSVYGNYSYFQIDTSKGYYRFNDLNGNLTHAEAIELPSYQTYTADYWNNFKEFMRTFYLNTRFTLTWQTTLIMVGVNAGLSVFLGFMVWILTRGKNNPYRIFTIWECQKITAWACLTPAILTVPFGFLISSFSQIAFALFLGVRIMWLSMKTLRPEYGSTSQAQYSNTKQVKTVDTKPVKEKKAK